jgi:hypothetical protein
MRRRLFTPLLGPVAATVRGGVLLWARDYSWCDYWRASEGGKCRFRFLVPDSGRVGYDKYAWYSDIPVRGPPVTGERWGYRLWTGQHS